MITAALLAVVNARHGIKGNRRGYMRCDVEACSLKQKNIDINILGAVNNMGNSGM